MKSPLLQLAERHQIDPSSILALFSALGDVYFFMKDRAGHFIGANEPQLDKLGLDAEEELIGKTDTDFFPSYLIAHYAKDDARVMETGEPILRRVELVANADGSVSWHVTSKFPLYNRKQQCIGIIGCMRDFDRSDHAWQPFRRMNAVVDYISQHYSEALEMADLARQAGLSISQFERRFRTVFQQTPSRFLIRYRLTRAIRLLVHSEETLTRIAQEVGFYDHSHFSREFRKLFGMSPGQYRREHQADAELGHAFK
ncbi:MAG: AraC family transcriptional regulator [Verrucomicrobiota bacterium]